MNEAEIRPQDVFDEYLRLCTEDTTVYFSSGPRVPIPCPACGTAGVPAFEKHGFAYEECPGCRTLFVSPRPAAAAFDRYYTESRSSKFWATTFYKQTAEARREKLWRPKALAVRDLCSKFSPGTRAIVDIGGGYGIFAEEMRALTGNDVTVIEPAPHLADVCRAKGLTVVQKFLGEVTGDDLPAEPKTFVSFELFEHLHDPKVFVGELANLMRSGELFIFTTLSSAGADIRSLWDQSKSVSPPHHLNFFTPTSVRRMIEQNGLEVVDVATPGALDIDIIVNNLAQNSDRFWRVFAEQADSKARVRMQKALAECGFSSHMRATCRKP